MYKFIYIIYYFNLVKFHALGGAYGYKEFQQRLLKAYFQHNNESIRLELEGTTNSPLLFFVDLLWQLYR